MTYSTSLNPGGEAVFTVDIAANACHGTAKVAVLSEFRFFISHQNVHICKLVSFLRTTMHFNVFSFFTKKLGD